MVLSRLDLFGASGFDGIFGFLTLGFGGATFRVFCRQRVEFHLQPSFTNGRRNLVRVDANGTVQGAVNYVFAEVERLVE